MLRIILIMLLSVLHATISLAEPSKTPKYLMDVSMSLFDWGIYKTNERLNMLMDLKLNKEAGLWGADASYDWDSNRIEIVVRVIGKGTEAECVWALKRLKAHFANFTNEENKQRAAAALTLNGLFSHEGGYQKADRPDDVGQQLIHITSLKATALIQKENGDLMPKVSCTTNYKTKNISVTQKSE